MKMVPTRNQKDFCILKRSVSRKMVFGQVSFSIRRLKNYSKPNVLKFLQHEDGVLETHDSPANLKKVYVFFLCDVKNRLKTGVKINLNSFFKT